QTPASCSRRGAACVAMRSDVRVVVLLRAANGLLGGMTEVPTTEWSTDFVVAHAITNAPEFPQSDGESAQEAGRKTSSKVALKVSWHRVPGVVTHVLTHFRLELIVLRARLPKSAGTPERMHGSALDAITGAALPSVMRKVLAHALVE